MNCKRSRGAFFAPHAIFLFCASTIGQVAQAQLTLTFTPSDHNGYNIACFGEKGGDIDLTVTGGTAPYTYAWSHGPTTQDVSGLPAGYYAVVVHDAGTLSGRKEITLTEPDGIRLETTVYEYPNGYNVSCYSCYNGSVQVETSGGVAPYTYQWSDGITSQNRSALGPDVLGVTVTDANGCEQRTKSVILRGPESSDWNRNGNAGTDPATQYIGTSDNKDVVFKSNANESLRLKSNGDIKLGGSLSNFGLLYRDQDGILRSGGFPDFPVLPGSPCRLLGFFAPYWKTTGNSFPLICPEEEPLLGTLDEMPLRIVTNGVQRIFINPEGKVGVGTEPPDGTIDQYRLFVEDGISTRDVLVKTGDWPDYVFAKEYPLPSIPEFRRFIEEHQHLPGLPSAAEVEMKGGIEIGDMQTRLVKVVEEQARYIVQMEERLAKLEQRLSQVEATQH
jgi:hypothetical protein